MRPSVGGVTCAQKNQSIIQSIMHATSCCSSQGESVRSHVVLTRNCVCCVKVQVCVCHLVLTAQSSSPRPAAPPLGLELFTSAWSSSPLPGAPLLALEVLSSVWSSSPWSGALLLGLELLFLALSSSPRSRAPHLSLELLSSAWSSLSSAWSSSPALLVPPPQRLSLSLSLCQWLL